MKNGLEKLLDKLYNSQMKVLFINDITYEKLRDPIEFLNQKLPKNILNRILNKDIYIIRTEAPSCQLDNATNKVIKHIITIDLNIFKTLDFTKEEIGCVILHEFGHIFNCPTNNKNKLNELYADDFVREQGVIFETHLLSGFKKYIEKDLCILNIESKKNIQLRLERIEKNEKKYLDGIEK